MFKFLGQLSSFRATATYVLERDMVFQKAFGHFIMRAVAMPPDDSLCFALNVPILDIWSSERLKLTEIG